MKTIQFLKYIFFVFALSVVVYPVYPGILDAVSNFAKDTVNFAGDVVKKTGEFAGDVVEDTKEVVEPSKRSVEVEPTDKSVVTGEEVVAVEPSEKQNLSEEQKPDIQLDEFEITEE